MNAVRHCIFGLMLLLYAQPVYCWGFFAHRKINYYAVFLLPPQMMVFYKPNLGFLSDHAVDPDKRRYLVAEEGPRHYIDIDKYGKFPFSDIPRNWDSATAKYSKDSVMANGIVPWWIPIMLQRLTRAFREKNAASILKLSSELGHYISDAHVPLHAHHNHNGQYTDQKGIHGFWESRVPELLAEKEFNFFIGKAAYLENPSRFIWNRVIESARAADTVLLYENQLSRAYSADQKYAFETRNDVLVKQYSAAYTIAYDNKLNHMVERRMRQSIFATACFWYTAWVNAGQPSLENMTAGSAPLKDTIMLDSLHILWKKSTPAVRDCDP